MSRRKPPCAPDRSRRRLIVAMAGVAGAAGIIGPAAALAGAAPRKLGKLEIGYQNAPKGAQRCELCVNWQPPVACKVVSGPISASGWCSLFARKA